MGLGYSVCYYTNRTVNKNGIAVENIYGVGFRLFDELLFWG